MRFMVIVRMVGEFDESFMAKADEDVAYSNTLRKEGTQGELFMTEDYRTCWSVYTADSREKLQEILEGFPLYDRLDYEVHPLVDLTSNPA